MEKLISLAMDAKITSFGLITGDFNNAINITKDPINRLIDISPVNVKNENTVYISLTKTQARILSKILKQMAKNL
jgi:hypothetical protein